MDEDNQSVDSPAQSNPGTPLPSNPDICNKMDIETEFVISHSTLFYADSVEWCPLDDMNCILACGTYQLNEHKPSTNAQFRDGNILLYELSSKEIDSNMVYDLRNVASISTNGILDVKWYPLKLNGKAILAAARSDGQISLHEINVENSVTSSVFSSYMSEDSQKMFLSLDWHFNCGSVIASDTSGYLNYFQMNESDLSRLQNWKAHDFECWISATDYFHPNTVFSGGDDCYFKSWDLRDVSTPTTVSKRHSMGVTAISKSKLNENLIATGSYDENVFLWDLRNLKHHVSDLCLQGGVWRLKWHPSNPNLLLSAAMHNGFHIVSISNNAMLLKFSFMEHESLAYGVDWSYGTVKKVCTAQHEVNNIIASCSFYDKKLSVWGINI